MIKFNSFLSGSKIKNNQLNPSLSKLQSILPCFGRNHERIYSICFFSKFHAVKRIWVSNRTHKATKKKTINKSNLKKRCESRVKTRTNLERFGSHGSSNQEQAVLWRCALEAAPVEGTPSPAAVGSLEDLEKYRTDAGAAVDPPRVLPPCPFLPRCSSPLSRFQNFYRW